MRRLVSAEKAAQRKRWNIVVRAAMKQWNGIMLGTMPVITHIIPIT